METSKRAATIATGVTGNEIPQQQATKNISGEFMAVTIAPSSKPLKSVHLFLPVFMMLYFSITLQGQSIKGTWYGKFGVPFNYRIVLHIDSTQNGYQLKTESPDSGQFGKAVTKYMGDSIRMWKDEMNHPNYDSFWKDRDPRQYLKNVKPAVMTVRGWFDAEDLYGTLHTYQAIEKQNPLSHPNYLVMGPWSHGQWSAGEASHLGNIYWGQNTNKSYQELEVKFFNYYLREKEKGEIPEATIFVTGANEWRTFNTWPPSNVTDQWLYFQPAGKLSFVPPAASESYDEYISDPMKPVPYSEKISNHRTSSYITDDQRFASTRPDGMVYQTDTLSDEITLTGPLTADLFVSTSGTDADYVVKLIDVFPQDMKSPADKELDVKLGGYQMLVRGEVFRGK